jgi:hypothetical protein
LSAEYSERFFEIQISFARRIAAIMSLPLTETVLSHTAIYKILGLSGEFDCNHPVWSSYVQGLGEDRHDAAWTYHIYRERYDKIPKFTDSPHWGCFAYHYLPHHRMVKLHFSNQDTSGSSPLSLERRPIRLAELHAMFAHIKRTHPQAVNVAGGSWLYNWDAYRCLFPSAYRQSVRPEPPRFQFRSLWGQFLRRDGEVREEPAMHFIQRIGGLPAAGEAASCFPFQVLAAQGDLRDFFAYYNV